MIKLTDKIWIKPTDDQYILLSNKGGITLDKNGSPKAERRYYHNIPQALFAAQEVHEKFEVMDTKPESMTELMKVVVDARTSFFKLMEEAFQPHTTAEVIKKCAEKYLQE